MAAEVGGPFGGERVRDRERYEGVVVGQHGPWSWVLVDGADEPTTYATARLARITAPPHQDALPSTSLRSDDEAVDGD